jgi:zinc transport system substrate-binding protein
MKNLKIIILLLLVVLGGLFFFVTNEAKVSTQKKPIVAVTTYALYDIVHHIAKDSVKIVNILPFGVDPHSFEPTPKLMAALEKSSLVIYSGAGLEPWTKGFVFHSKVIDMSRYVNLRRLKKGDDSMHMHNSVDPHYWLDFGNMQKATKVITKALIELLPQNKKLYEEEESRYIAMLQNLDKLYKEHLSSCRVKSVVVSHNALGYLARDYGFHVESLTGLSPEAEPSAKDVTRIMQDIKKEGVTTIFFEHFVNDSIIKRIAQDAHIKLDVFQPIGNITKDEAEAHLTYEDIMKKNLQKLSKALMCQ